TSGDREFGAMNISATYRLETKDGAARLVRVGDLLILPPIFDPGRDRLTAGQIALVRILQRRFGRLFQEEIAGEGLELPGRWKELGTLKLVELQSDRGWLNVSWVAPSEDEVATGGDGDTASVASN